MLRLLSAYERSDNRRSHGRGLRRQPRLYIICPSVDLAPCFCRQSWAYGDIGALGKDGKIFLRWDHQRDTQYSTGIELANIYRNGMRNSKCVGHCVESYHAGR